MLTCVLSLTACGGEKKTLEYNQEAVDFAVDSIFNMISATDEASIDELYSYNDDQLAEISDSIAATSNGLIKMEGKTLIAAVESWHKSLPDIGDDYKATGSYEYTAKEKELIVGYEISGSKHNAVMEVIYDKNFHITSITTNVTYSFDECMQKAGVNTAVGMGTVFAMLIIIMIIIYILGAICGPKKEAPKKEVIVEETVDKTIEAIVEREEDDTELIAVIAAAIAASEGASSTDGFVVRSIRKIR